MADNTSARRLTNKKNAFQFATLGLGVFVSDGKVPLIPRYNKWDHEITAEERDAAVTEYAEKHDGAEPAHVGCTKDIAVLKKLFRLFPDAVPSIACGPSKLLVLDADAKDNGPELLGALFAENGGVPAGVPVIPTRSGGQHLIFADPEGKYTNKAGLLKKQYGTDVRGTGGQFVAPGSMRVDGKTYGTNDDKLNFLRAIHANTIPTIPEFIVEKIGAVDPSLKEEIAPTKEREVIKSLQDDDITPFENAFDAVLGDYDLDKLKASNKDFAELYDNPSDDCSTNRFLAARMVMTEWPSMPVQALSIFFGNWEGAGVYTDDKPRSGEYDDRQIAREWLKNQGLSKQSTGEAFGAVDDDDEYDREIRQDKEREKLAAMKAEDLFFAGEWGAYNEPDYIVENTFTPQQIGMIHGPSNVGKTFTVIHLGERIVAGEKWFGLNVAQGGVLYCFGEGHAGLRNRLYAYRKVYNDLGLGMVVRGGIPNLALNLKAARKALRKAIVDANKMYAERGMSPVKVVFLDTFAKAIAGAQENDVAAIQPILNALRELCIEMEVCIVIVHHSGKDTLLGPRGSSAIVADVDFNLEILSHAEAKKRKLNTVKPGNLAIVSPKMRDSGKAGVLQFKLQEVQLGTNRWGNPVTSMAVVEGLDATPGSDGSAFGAAPEDDAEAPTSTDALTPEQNRKEQEQRIELCARVAAAVQQAGVDSVEGRMASVEAVQGLVPALAKLRAECGRGNFAKAIRRVLLDGEPSVLLPSGGWLQYLPATGRRNSSFAIKLNR
jgi:hypothetical protein